MVWVADFVSVDLLAVVDVLDRDRRDVVEEAPAAEVDVVFESGCELPPVLLRGVDTGEGARDDLIVVDSLVLAPRLEREVNVVVGDGCLVSAVLLTGVLVDAELGSRLRLGRPGVAPEDVEVGILELLLLLTTELSFERILRREAFEVTEAASSSILRRPADRSRETYRLVVGLTGDVTFLGDATFATVEDTAPDLTDTAALDLVSEVLSSTTGANKDAAADLGEGPLSAPFAAAGELTVIVSTNS